VLGDDFTGFKAARAWFAYSLLLLPPPLKDDQGRPIPGPTTRPGEHGHDPAKHRVPRLPMLIIFRQGAPRAQSYQAELEQKEGWFDEEGWRIDDTSDPDNWWFPDPARPGFPQDIVVGKGRAWSLEEWQKAARMWTKHGNDNGLILNEARLAEYNKYKVDINSLPAEPTPEQLADPDFRRRDQATKAVFFYSSNRHVTNFPYFLAAAEAEERVVDGKPVTVLARKTLWLADQARKLANTPKAIALYHDGLKQWKQVLIDNPTFHRTDRTEEETYEFELAYLRLLVQSDERVRERANVLAHTLHGVVPFLTEPFVTKASVKGAQYVPDPLWSDANRTELRWYIVETVSDADFSSPFVGSLAKDGGPWIREEMKTTVRVKQNVQRRLPGSPTGQPQPQPQPVPGTPGASSPP
jgi:hypothetical protein